MNVKNLAEAEGFYTGTLGAEIVRRVEPSQDERGRGRVDEVHVQLGNFQVHLKDASGGTSQNVAHHTLMNDWQERDLSIGEVEATGAHIEKLREHGDGRGYSLYVRDPDDNQFELWYGE